MHMEKMIAMKESTTETVPELDLQINLSNLVFSLQKHFKQKQRKRICEWNSKLTQRKRRKTRATLNEDALSNPAYICSNTTESK